MKIDLKHLTAVPVFVMSALTVHTYLSFAAVEGMEMLSYLTLGISLLAFVIMLMLTLRKTRLTKFGIAVSLFCFLLLAFTIINSTDIKNCVYMVIDCLTLIMLFGYYGDRTRMLITTAAIATSICVYIGILHMMKDPSWIVFTEKANHGYLLGGNYNSMGCRMMCAILTNLICLRYSKRWILNIVPLILVSIVALGLLASMTSLSCILAFLMLSLIPSAKIKKITLAGIVAIFVLFQTFIVFNGEGIENNDAARYVVEDVLGKDITFTQRTPKWIAAGKAFAKSPIIGYGYVDQDWYLSNLVSEAVGPHNFCFFLLLNGGLVLFILFFVTLFMSCKKIIHYNEYAAIAIMCAVTFFFIMQLMEYYPLYFNFYLLLLMYYYPQIRIQKNKCKQPATLSAS